MATALLMDAYPPGMHSFRPEHVFESLYRDLCLSAWIAHGDPDPRQHGDAVRGFFVDSFDRMGPVHSALAVRREALMRFGQAWPGVRLPTACIFCLGRAAEHQLPCQHAMCDSCITVFGQPTPGAEYHRDLTQCPLCQERFCLTVRQLPPTKRPVVLTLDGGGVRGMVTLGLLRALEQRLAGAITTVSEIPDLTAGVSVGTIIGTDLVYNDTSAADSCRRFLAFARHAFQPACSWKERWPGLAFVLGFLTDGLYDSSALDRTIHQVCPPTRQLFDVMPPWAGGRRLALIASRISDGKPVVFPKYRGIGRPSVDMPYQTVASQGDERNPLLAGVIRCSVAAPGFFQCQHLPEFGALQDGGVRANNPHGIAQEECRVIWPSAQKELAYAQHVQHVYDPVRDKAPFRLWRAYQSSPCMDGAEAFLEGLNHVPHVMRRRTFRLDHAFLNLPRLDDLESLTALAGLPYTVPDELVRAVLATCFFFELDEGPTRVCDQYLCRGSVLCARRRARWIMKRVLVEFPGAELQTDRGDRLGRVDDDDGCTACGYYRKRVSFSIASLDEEMSITFAGPPHRYPVGGFPSTVRQFLQNQQADAVFGRSDHQTNQWPPKRACYCPRATKRPRLAEPLPQRKKRRL